MKIDVSFDDLVVLEWGRRPAVLACGGLLAQLGATVLTFEDRVASPALSRFKTVLADTEAERAAAFARANIIVISSDRRDEPDLPGAAADKIVVDLTVDGTGEHGHWSEPLLQAAAGIADITGTPDTPPTICDAPFVELQTAIFAAAGALVAWPRLATFGVGQVVALSLVDCAVNNLSSFLPLVFAGKAPQRSGNRHPMAVPWNSFRTKDGWILLCSATDEHWTKLCTLMGREDLATGRFAKLADRVDQCDAVDAAVEAWTATLSVEDCVAALNGAGLAAGPILSLRDLSGDPNLIHRGSIGQTPIIAPLSFLKTEQGGSSRSGSRTNEVPPPMPLAGLRVVEIGQYTTAPLAAKQLALLGAEVIKIEPPKGEASRAWPPHQDGQGYFFTMNNANKRSCQLDLRQDDDRTLFEGLLARSDVLIENMKPGSLEKLGFDWGRLSRINPRIVYCGISGFGKTSAYPGRPAFDTVVQAMSGLMDVTRANGAPVKLGVSAADVTGGIAGLFAVVVGLERRRRTAVGMMIDLSMQDVAVWLTQSLWGGAADSGHSVVQARDGYVVTDRSRTRIEALLTEAGRQSRAKLVDALASSGVRAAPVRSLGEIADDVRRGRSTAISIFLGNDNKSWPLFESPYWFSRETTAPAAPIGHLGEANAYVDGLMRQVRPYQSRSEAASVSP
jgi:crotonobetainyl-CoA:carnitine CoA-transferase CaiB-like acyl-CoA transferase